MNKVEVLILSSTIDYSTDLVCIELEKQDVSYLRVNRDAFSEYEIIYDLENGKLTVVREDGKYVIDSSTLKSIYFRAPVYLRFGKSLSIEEQLSKSQWNAFLRNLVVFDKAKWINHPVDTYRAENKLLQLEIAQRVGLKVPKTFVGNSLPENINVNEKYVVKSLDTVLLYEGDDELFSYSNVVTGEELLEAEISSAPIILQEFLEDKIDLRVTIVENNIFPVQVLSRGNGIYGDWRKTKKDELQYVPAILPASIELKLLDFMDKMNLKFAGIDLALVGNQYYFIESNPTGEWGWLKKTAGCEIDCEIAKALFPLKNVTQEKEPLLTKIRNMIFPMWDNRKKNKKMKIKRSELETKKNGTVRNTYCVLSNVRTEEINLISTDSLQKVSDEVISRKRILEEKAKTNTVGITIAITLIMGAYGMCDNVYGRFFNPVVHMSVFFLFAIAVFYMIVAGIISIRTITEENIVFVPRNNGIGYGEEKLKEELDFCIGANSIQNIIRNNNIYTSYQCIKNALVCLFIVMMISTFPINWGSSKNIDEVKMLDESYFYSYDAAQYISANDLEKTVRENIKNFLVELPQPIEEKSYAFLDEEEKLFIEIDVKNDEIKVLDITPNNRSGEKIDK